MEKSAETIPRIFVKMDISKTKKKKKKFKITKFQNKTG